MSDRSRTTSRAVSRPLLGRSHARRALVNVGGRVETAGDATLGAALTEALTVRPGERDATLTHPFHAYPARLHPEVARRLVAALCPSPGARVLDPFCGSGTVLVEALVAGHAVWGRDLSPLAVELAALKTARPSGAAIKLMVSTARGLAARARSRTGRAPAGPASERAWYLPHTFAELSALSAEIAALPDGFVRHALRMLLSSVLVKVSLQASDADARRVAKHVAPGTALSLFAYKARELEACLKALRAAAPPGATVDVAVDDAQRLDTVPAGSIDAVVTSPPYANTYDYADHHARRYAWLGLDARAMASQEIGAARWFTRDPAEGAARFADELESFCGALGRVLAPGGRAAVVIADGAAAGTALRADEMIARAAAAQGLSVLARASQEREVFDRDSALAFAKKAKREHVLVVGRAAVVGG